MKRTFEITFLFLCINFFLFSQEKKDTSNWKTIRDNIKNETNFLKDNLNDPSHYNKRGRYQFKLENYAEAIKDFDKAIKLKPDNADYYSSRGLSKSRLGDHKSAVIDYNKAIELNPYIAVFYSNRAISIGKLGDNKSAILDYTRAIDLDSTNASSYNDRGYYKYLIGDKQKALEDYNKAIKLNPGKIRFYYNRADCEIDLGKYDNAIQDIDQIFEISHPTDDLYIKKSYCQVKMNDYKAAIESCNKAIELAPNSINAFNNRGLFYYELGEYALAIKDFDKTIQLDSNNSKYYTNKANAEKKLGHKTASLQDYRKAAELDYSDNSGAKRESWNPANYLKAPYKSGLAAKDKSDIQKRAKECFENLAEFEFNISPTDILPFKSRVFEYPRNRKKAEELKKILWNNPSDETICMGLGSIYKELKNDRQAKLYLDSAENIIKRNLIKTPNDSTQMSNLAWVYLIADNFEAALREYDNYLAQYPGSLDAMEGRLFCILGSGDEPKLLNECNKLIEKYPERVMGYIIMPLFRILEKNNKITALPKDSIADYQNLRIDDFIDIHELSAAAKTYSNNFEMQFVYNELRQMCLFVKVILQEQKLSENDKKEVKRLEMFYEDALTRKDQASKFTFYKLLGVLNMIDYNKGKAIEYTRKAIESKEKEDTLRAPNTTSLYDQLAGVYLLKGEKKEGEKVLIEKIKKTGTHYENGHDYLVLASYKIANGNLEGAKSDCFTSMEIDSNTVDHAYLGLATIDVLKGNIKDADAELNMVSEKIWEKSNFLTLKGVVDLLKGNYKSAKEFFILSKERDKDFELPKQLLKKYFIE